MVPAQARDELLTTQDGRELLVKDTLPILPLRTLPFCRQPVGDYLVGTRPALSYF